jgi:hypothetical protein
MTYHLTLENNPGYLHATVTGENTADNAARFLRETYEACVARGFNAVLLEMNLTGPGLAIGEIYRVIAEGSATGKRLQKIGYVDGKQRDRLKLKFAETVARNRAVNVRLFDDIAEARRWMSEGT